MISDEQLGNRKFSDTDAIFITASAEIEFLKATHGIDIRDALLIPISFHALGSVLRFGHSRFYDYLPLVDFDLCRRGYDLFERQSKTWLGELGLKFEVDGINIAVLDAPNQFLLFSQASYIENLAARILDDMPSIETFYILKPAELLPLDYYFDSDTATGVLQFACARSKRTCKTLAMTRQSLRFTTFPERPFLGRHLNCDTSAETVQSDLSMSRVGLCPGGMANHQSIAEELHKLQLHSVIFNSSWGLEWGLGHRQGEQLVSLSSYVQPDDTETEARCARLWDEFKRKRGKSSLIDAVIRNPYLDFQLHYLITRRWLRLASLVRAAKRAAKEIPLDLFVCCELCHDEGAILATAYRASGAKILVFPHSRWPCDPTWSHWNASDVAVTRTQSAADRLRQIAGVSRVFVLGPTSPETATSSEAETVATRKEMASGRNIVVVLTNALELLDAPFVAPLDHIKSMSILGRVPLRLRSKLLVAVRAKPGVLSEDTIIYQTLSSFSEESVSFLSGLTFSECLQLADCVVGVNLPTSGYFEILERGIPLIHLQMAAVTTKHPDLPGTVVQQITTADDLWPAIESVLFDANVRSQTIERQRRFIDLDMSPTSDAAASPLQTVIRGLMKKNENYWRGMANYFATLRRKFTSAR